MQACSARKANVTNAYNTWSGKMQALVSLGCLALGKEETWKATDDTGYHDSSLLTLA